MSDVPYEVLANRYELHRQLATGGTADVFLARDQLLNRPVAVKVLNATLSQDEAFVQRLRQEAQVVASLNHQNIVGVFDQGEQDGAPFIVMEYVDGQTLSEILRNEGRIDPDRAASIAIDVAAALDAAHRQGMVHMDVKPGNVLITNDGLVKLTDFGIAKALNEGNETDLTIEDGTVLGTATYLSPEQAQGDKVGPRSDVYSLSVVLYEMLAGRPPFVGANPGDIARQHVEASPESLSGLGIDVAQSLEAITFKGLAKKVEHRYPSVRDFAADLKRYLGGAHSLKGTATAPPQARPVTGRSTPPDDATVVMPAATTVGAAAVAGGATMAGTRAPVASPAATPQDAEIAAPQPIAIRSDDTWKRNVLFFVFFCILLVLLAFLANSLFAVLRSSSGETELESTPAAAATVTVENFINFEQSQAESLIEAAGLIPVISAEPNNDVAEGRVFAQDPPAGALVEEGSSIEITVSQAEGQLEVPTLVDLTRGEAELQLGRRGFTANVVEVDNNNVPAGVVIRQDPAAGVSSERGSVVFLEVSLGPSERTVPDLVGAEFQNALDEIADLDFRIAIVEEPSESIEEGLVIRTEPEAGSLLRGRETVTIFQSTGIPLVAVPSVIGLLPDTARQQLVASGFDVVIDFEPAQNPNDINRVLAQSPDANIELREGESVRIVVGEESEEGAETPPGDGAADDGAGDANAGDAGDGTANDGAGNDGAGDANAGDAGDGTANDGTADDGAGNDGAGDGAADGGAADGGATDGGGADDGAGDGG